MAEYISRDDAEKALLERCKETGYGGLTPNDIRLVMRTPWRIPPADVRPVVRGRWNRTDAYPHRLYCSVCYKTYLKNDELLERWEFPLNFCPNCGADMREEI